MTGRFKFNGMTIQVEEHRAELTGDVSYWLRRVGSEPEVTVGVKRAGRPLSVSNLCSIEARDLDAALRQFLTT